VVVSIINNIDMPIPVNDQGSLHTTGNLSYHLIQTICYIIDI